MFWTNKELTKQVKEFDWGQYPFIQLGEFGRGRKALNVCTTNLEFEKLEAFKILPYTIVFTKTSNLKMLSGTTGIFIAIDTMGAYIRGARGEISVTKSTLDNHLAECVGFGWGAFGDAGRIGTGDAAILKCAPGAVIRYNMTRAADRFIVVKSKEQILHFGSKADLDAAIDSGVVELPPDTEWVKIGSNNVVRPEPQTK